jgi:antitoxin (DNA-binding transcriptional repressor) of toxin-antitoxin stability system
LPELIESLLPGEELRILQDDRTVAKLVRQPPPSRSRRQPGSAKGKILYMADDFDAIPEDLNEYLC